MDNKKDRTLPDYRRNKIRESTGTRVLFLGTEEGGDGLESIVRRARGSLTTGFPHVEFCCFENR